MEQSLLNGVTSEALQQVYNLIHDSDWVTGLQFTINEEYEEDCLLVTFTNVDGRLMGAEVFEYYTNLYVIEFIKSNPTDKHNTESWSLWDENYDTKDFVRYIHSLPKNLSSVRKLKK